jgi:hypothetical protein
MDEAITPLPEYLPDLFGLLFGGRPHIVRIAERLVVGFSFDTDLLSFPREIFGYAF